MLDHQAAVLHDFDAGSGQCFRRRVIADPGLKPYRLRSLGQDIVNVTGDVWSPAKNIYQVDVTGNLLQPAINRLT
jgi:hypothetical protein